MISEPILLRWQREHEHKAMLEDISVGGACIRTDVRMHCGETIALLMNLGVTRRFDAPARVVYALPDSDGFQARYGVRFVALPESDQREITSYIVEQKCGRQLGVRPMRAGAQAPESTF